MLKICYLLQSSDMSGGVRIVFDQAMALSALGHKVTIRALRGDHSWYPYPVQPDYVNRLDAPFHEKDQPDAVVCTYWTTVEPGIRIGAGVTLHLCQGYEGMFPELRENWAEIQKIYRLPIPKITIGDWISDLLRNTFGSGTFPVYTVGQIVDTSVFKPSGIKWTYFFPWCHTFLPIKILVVGDYALSCKGIAISLGAVELLRKRGVNIHLIRVSLHPPNPDELNITKTDESYVKISPLQMALVYRKADLLISSCLPSEGFGLPFAEALASGLPAVAARIPSYESIADGFNYPFFIDENTSKAMADAVTVLISSRKKEIKRIRKEGPKRIRNRYNAQKVAANIESVLTGLPSND